MDLQDPDLLAATSALTLCAAVCCSFCITHLLSLSVSLLSALTVAEFPSKGFSVTFEDHNF